MAYKSADTDVKGDFIKQMYDSFQMSQTQISRLLNVSRSTVNRRLNSSPFCGPRVKRGRPSLLTEAMRLHVEARTIEDRRVSGMALASELETKFGVKISEKTIERVRHELGFKYRPPINSVLLTPRAKQRRVAWAQEQLDIRRDWSKVVFSDESYFHLTPEKTFLWRRSDEEGDDVRLHKQQHPPKILIWGGIGKDYKTDLVIVESGTVDQTVYITEVISGSGLIETAENHFGKEWFLQQDNARPHTSRFSREQLIEMNVEVLPGWPPYSPDLNVIETIWAIMKYRVGRKNPKSIEELKIIVRTVWYELSFETINKLIDSMPERCRKVIENGGMTLK